HRGLADDRHGGNASGRDQGAVSGSRARGAARIRTRGAGPTAASAHRLGGHPPAGAGGTLGIGGRAETVSGAARPAWRAFSTRSSFAGGKSFPWARAARPTRPRDPGDAPTS